MPLVSRRRIVESLNGLLTAEQAEEAFASALDALKLKEKPLYRPEEVALIGQVLMLRAQASAAGVSQS